MRRGRLALPLAAALVVACVCVAPSFGRVQTRHALVVSGRGFKLFAWDRTSPKGSLCVLAKAGRPNSSVCAQKLNPATGLMFTSFQDSKQTFTVVGGASRKNIKKVMAMFADGSQVTVKTKQGQAYRGRRKGKVRFWALKHKGRAPLRSVMLMP